MTALQPAAPCLERHEWAMNLRLASGVGRESAGGSCNTQGLFRGAGLSQAARLQKRLQDQHGRHAVDGLGALLDAEFGLTQQAVGLRRGKSLIPQVNGKLKALTQFLGKFSHFLRLRPVFAAHAQRVAQNDLADLVFTNRALQTAEVGPLVFPFQGLQSLGSDAQQIRNRQPHAAAAVVDGQNASRFHPAIIRRKASYLCRMATNRIIPPAEEQLRPQEVPDAQKDAAQLRRQEQRQLGRSLHAGAVAQVMIALAIALMICYFGKLVLVTLLVSILITFMLEPIVALLERIRIPRALGALVAVLLLMAALYGISYFFYNRAMSFAHELPRYSHKIQGMLSHITKQTSELEKTTQQVLPKSENQGQKPLPVRVENGASSGLITENIGTVTETVLTLCFIPFLVYFMLSWREHARTKSVQLFRPEFRSTAYVTMGQISLMMKSFIAGNFIIGLFISIGSVVVFGLLGLPYFYFLGFISGFLSLMPYLGVLLALIPPLTAGIGNLSSTGMIIVGGTVLGLHLVAMNVLYPKVLGKRLQLNPMVVTIALLIWGFIWGAMGLVLAVPIMGAVKIICDHVSSLRPVGQWLGD